MHMLFAMPTGIPCQGAANLSQEGWMQAKRQFHGFSSAAMR